MNAMFPDFLGIGCYRAGSTWLHDLLDAHPHAYVPQRRKEVHFFLDSNYGRGLGWYENFFPRDDERRVYQAVGEIGPGYLYHPDCIRRIASVPSISRFLVILRDPVDRAYSHYCWQVRYSPRPPTFLKYAATEPRILEEGLYAKYLRSWLEAFGRERFQILFLEEVRRDFTEARRHVANFLGLDPELFPKEAGAIATNQSRALDQPGLYHVAVRTYRWFIRHDLDTLIQPFVHLGKRAIAGGGATALPALDQESRRFLKTYYERANAELSELLHLALPGWQ